MPENAVETQETTLEGTVFGLTKEEWLKTQGISSGIPVEEPMLGNHQSHGDDEDFLDFVMEGARQLNPDFVKKIM